MDEEMKKVRPSFAEVQEAKGRAIVPLPRYPKSVDTFPTDGTYEPMDVTPLDPAPADPNTQDPALGGPEEPMTGSRQLRGETLGEFVLRMEEEEREGVQRESEEEESNRLERKRIAERERRDKKLAEPTVGTAMYEWIRRSSGCLLRKPVPRAEWYARWRRYEVSARRYLAFHDEWDLELPGSCDGDDSENQCSEDEDSDDEATMQQFMGTRHVDHSRVPPKPARDTTLSASIIRPRLVEPSSNVSISQYADDVRSTYGAPRPYAQVDQLPLVDILLNRYGFDALDPGLGACSSRLRDIKMVEGNVEQPLPAMARLGVKKLMGGQLDQVVLDIYNFFISNTHTPRAFPPIWDFHPHYHDLITRNGVFQYQRAGRDVHLLGVTGSPLSSQWYVLAIRDATTILQIFRQSPRSLLGIARDLLNQGTPFHTVKCVKEVPSPPPERPNFGLGHRPEGHKFHPCEYSAYERAKSNILSSAFGRVALLRGGILWRLAKDMVSIKSVTRGPTSSCKTQGNLVGRYDSYGLVDDFLTSEEEDIICGVYHVYTGSY